jgi:hypothetical protein
MAANRQQGNTLAVLLVGFTALPAGLVASSNHLAAGALTAILGVALIVGSLFQMYRLKPLELADDEGGK